MQSSAPLPTTQRRLILIRHAKAVEDDVGDDHARGLSQRGLADAAALGAWLAEHHLTPDLALCSTASRTRQTLAGLGRNIPTILSDKIYLATTGELLTQVQTRDDAMQTLMLVCHNPGAHGLLGLLAGSCANEVDADRMLLKFPTSACAVLDFDAAGWRDIAPNSARLTILRY